MEEKKEREEENQERERQLPAIVSPIFILAEVEKEE